MRFRHVSDVKLAAFLPVVALALVVCASASAKTPPPAAVGNVGLALVKFGTAIQVGGAKSDRCAKQACVKAAFVPIYLSAQKLDTQLMKLWIASGKSGPCSDAAGLAGAQLDLFVQSLRRYEAVILKKAAAARAAAAVGKTVTAFNKTALSFNTKCV